MLSSNKPASSARSLGASADARSYNSSTGCFVVLMRDRLQHQIPNYSVHPVRDLILAHIREDLAGSDAAREDHHTLAAGVFLVMFRRGQDCLAVDPLGECRRIPGADGTLDSSGGL